MTEDTIHLTAKSGDSTREHYRLTTGEHKKWPVYRRWADWVDKWAAARD